MVVADGVDPQACGSGGDRSSLLTQQLVIDRALKPSVRPQVAARKFLSPKGCAKSEALSVLQTFASLPRRSLSTAIASTYVPW